MRQTGKAGIDFIGGSSVKYLVYLLTHEYDDCDFQAIAYFDTEQEANDFLFDERCPLGADIEAVETFEDIQRNPNRQKFDRIWVTANLNDEIYAIHHPNSGYVQEIEIDRWIVQGFGRYGNFFFLPEETPVEEAKKIAIEKLRESLEIKPPATPS